MMNSIFRILGLLVALYTIYASVTGEVYAKSGASGRTVSRHESPRYFWTVVAIYAALSMALMTIF
jgi:hypothetical protein